MTIDVVGLAPAFAARIDGVDISRPVDDATWKDIRAAFEEHSVLVFRGRPLNLVVWDNRCILHRATPYDTTRYRRLMQRTTVSGDPAELVPA